MEQGLREVGWKVLGQQSGYGFILCSLVGFSVVDIVTFFGRQYQLRGYFVIYGGAIVLLILPPWAALGTGY